MTTRVPVGVFFALFTLSGFAGLIYESIWSHYLKLFLGHAAYAQTLVLAIFMGGMAIGSWLVSRFTHRIPNLLLGYALAELFIGVMAIAFHRVFVATTGWAFDSVLPALAGSGVDLFKWTLASLLILPASILLGTTFPLMSGGIIRLYPEASGRTLSMLYFTNSFGAAIGVLASGFILIDRVGLPGTILTAGILNVALAIVVWAITRAMGAPPAPAPAAASTDGSARALARLVLLLAFATGAASFIYEIAWIRMLSLGLGASTHAFEVMLSAFILAMSLGAFWFRRRIDRLGNDTLWLAGLLLAKALLAAYAIWVYGDVLAFIRWTMQAVSRTDGGYALTTAAGLVASMLVMFPTAFCAGMTLPLATHVLTSRGLGEASIGRVYGANTAGCIVGAAFATHVGMESFGVKGLTGAGALLDIAVGALILLSLPWAPWRARAWAGFAAVAIAGSAAFFAVEMDKVRMISGVYREGTLLDPAANKVLFYRDGKTATIAVAEAKGMRVILTNGKPDASLRLDPKLPATPDEPTQVLIAALPLAVKPDAKLAANIGFGSGLTTHALLGSPRLERVDSVEIERMMIEGARLIHPRNRRAYEDPRSRIHIEDAKTFFASRGERYDIIISEPSNPWVSGVSTLFSEEFYGQVKRYLSDDGVLVQWVQGYEMDLDLLATVFNALGRHFADYTVYSDRGLDFIILAKVKGALPPLSAKVFELPDMGDYLRHLGFQELRDLESLRVGGRRVLEPLFAQTGYPANSDYFPILDQRASRARFKQQHVVELAGMRADLAPLMPVLDGEWSTPLSRIAAAGLNRPARVDAALVGSEAVGIALTGAAGQARVLKEADRAAALVVHGLLDGCQAAQREWAGALTQVVRLSAPLLAQADMSPLFARVRASRCMRSLDEVNRARVELLMAIHERDRPAMGERARFLLQKAPDELDGERAYYVKAAVASALAAGRQPEAAALLDRHFSELTPEDRRTASVRLAVAHAYARPATPPVARAD